MLGFSPLSSRTISGLIDVVIPPPIIPITGGHFIPYSKKQIAALKKRREEKLEAAKLLRLQIEEARNPPQLEADIVPNEPSVLEDLNGRMPLNYDPTPQLRARLYEIYSDLREIAQQQRKIQDEQDMEIILALLNNELKNYSIH